MLFIMTQKESEIDDLSIGSVADKLIRRSDIPVLSVTPVIQNDHYPFRALFGSINQPIDWFDLNDHLITADWNEQYAISFGNAWRSNPSQ